MFSASASASASAVTYNEQIVTASASASAISEVSIEDAYNKASDLANKIAQQNALDRVNIINQSLNIQVQIETYDYIIVGAGAAGSVLAARLSEDPSVSVLLLEHGHDNSTTSNVISDYDKTLLTTPVYYPFLYERYHGNTDKNIAPFGLEASPCHSDFCSIKENDTRYYSYSRGNGSGGSTHHHALVHGRGTPYIYDSISKLVNDDIWSYNNILKYYKKSEKCNIPYVQDNTAIHGQNGWLQIRHTGKIEEDLRLETINELERVLGVKYSIDQSEPEQVVGVSIASEQVDDKGLRVCSFSHLLQPLLTRTNLTIKYNHLVEKVLIDDNMNANGVIAYGKPYLADVNITGNYVDALGNAHIPDKTLSNKKQFLARKEVIICAGAITSPQILMLSGIGPAEQLKNIGVDVKVNLPGVGQNLMDHMESTISFSLDPEKIMWKWQATYMKQYTDYKNLATPAICEMIEKYADPNGLTTNGVSLMWDWYSQSNNPNINELEPGIINPDSHTHVITAFFFDFNLDFDKFPNGDTFHALEHANDNDLPPNSNFPGLSKKPLFFNQVNPANPNVQLSFLSECLHSIATGSITLVNNNPARQPIIDLGYYKDDNALDVNAKAMLKIRDFMKKSSLINYAKDPSNYDKFELYPGTDIRTLDEMKKHLADWQAWGHHMAGTCKIGANNDPTAVLDSKMKVRGVNKLRVVDCSVYPAPYLHGFNPSCGVYAIAEMASDLIKLANI